MDHLDRFPDLATPPLYEPASVQPLRLRTVGVFCFAAGALLRLLLS